MGIDVSRHTDARVAQGLQTAPGRESGAGRVRLAEAGHPTVALPLYP